MSLWCYVPKTTSVSNFFWTRLKQITNKRILQANRLFGNCKNQSSCARELQRILTPHFSGRLQGQETTHFPQGNQSTKHEWV